MNGIFTIARETFLLLRRDRIFLPAVLGGLITTIVANLASDWSIEDFSKILFDVGMFGFQMFGSLVAIFWGTKLIHDSKQDGSVEQQLAAPIGRTTWIIGRYLGLALCLAAMTAIFIVIWQGFMLLNSFGYMKPLHYNMFLFMYLGWLVISAMAVVFASFCGSGVALFSSFSLWIAGLASNIVYQNLPPNITPFTKGVVETLARIWDLQQFNLISDYYQSPTIPASELALRSGYAFGLIALLITIAGVWFSRRDVIS